MLFYIQSDLALLYLGGSMQIEERIERMQLEKPSVAKTKEAQSNIPWVEKYRPSHLSDLISHESILKTLKTFVDDSNLPNLLFYGPPGTGKTSTIVAVARQLYKKDYKSMVMELNASDERGINVVRDEIKKFADTKALSSNRNMKLIILDEADMMTNTAQFALRRIIEKFHTNARFCLIANYVSKIIPALQSRCTRFKFKQIPFEAAKTRIERICGQEKLFISPSGIEAVFRLCMGDMRRVVNMLQSLSMMESQSEINDQTVYDFTGNPSPTLLREFMNILLNDTVEMAFTQLNSVLRERGIALESIIRNIYLIVLETVMTQEQTSFIVNRLGDIEYRLSIGCQQSLALASLVGAFSEIRVLPRILTNIENFGFRCVYYSNYRLKMLTIPEGQLSHPNHINQFHLKNYLEPQSDSDIWQASFEPYCIAHKYQSNKSLPTFNLDGNYYTPSFMLEQDQVRQQLYQQKLFRADSIYRGVHQGRVKEAITQNNQLWIPKPSVHNCYCSVCRTGYSDYLSHISTTKHQTLTGKSVYSKHIRRICSDFSKNITKTKQTQKQYKRIDRKDKPRQLDEKVSVSICLSD